MSFTLEEEARLRALLPGMEKADKKSKLEEMMARLQQNTATIEAKRIDMWNELKRKLDAGDYTDLPSDINILDLGADPTPAFPDIIIAKEQISDDK